MKAGVQKKAPQKRGLESVIINLNKPLMHYYIEPFANAL